MNDDIKHSRLTYNCDAGEASVNVRTGRMIFTHPDLSIGKGSFNIGISHVYNPAAQCPPGVYPSMGSGWKLNVQQYIIANDYNTFTYVDGAGYSHTFEYLKTTGSVQNFYDKTGLNLSLTVPGAGCPYTIKDSIGNQMNFNGDGQLIGTVAAYNNGIKKNYIYKNGKLRWIYDSRNGGQDGEQGTGRCITLNYSQTNGLLASIQYTTDENVNLTIYYEICGYSNRRYTVCSQFDRHNAQRQRGNRTGRVFPVQLEYIGRNRLSRFGQGSRRQGLFRAGDGIYRF